MLNPENSSRFDKCPQEPTVHIANRLQTQMSRQQNFQMYQPHPQQDLSYTNQINSKRFSNHSNLKKHQQNQLNTNRFRVNGYNNKYEKQEHQREFKIMKKKVKNCKSLSQRKKDHFDPLVFPTYFFRDQKNKKQISLKDYQKKILSKNRTTHLLPSQFKIKDKIHHNNSDSSMFNIKFREKRSSPIVHYQKEQYPIYQNQELASTWIKKQNEKKDFTNKINGQQLMVEKELKRPRFYGNNNKNQFNAKNALKLDFNYALSRQSQRSRAENHLNHLRHPQKTVFYQQIQSNNYNISRDLSQVQDHRNSKNLPNLSTKDLIKYIIDKRIFKNQDFQVLKKRMIHQYGEKTTQPIWKYAMQHFYRFY